MNQMAFFIMIGLPTICGTLIILTFLFLNATRGKKNPRSSTEEAKILQEMHQSLLRMEKRIDALETIYFDMDRSSKGEK